MSQEPITSTGAGAADMPLTPESSSPSTPEKPVSSLLNRSEESRDADWSAVPDNPESYALQFAPDVRVDEELASCFREAAHRLGLSKGQAQELADLYAMRAGNFQAQYVENLNQSVAQWEGEIKARPAYRQEVGHAQRALAKYGSSDLNAIMDDTRIGSHPALFDFMAKVGRALAEPEFRGNSASSGPLTVEKILYPYMN